MTNKKASNNNIFSANDAFDINELASLNEDITPEFIEQLQNQIAQGTTDFSKNNNETLNQEIPVFEEVSTEESINSNIDIESPDIKTEETIIENNITETENKKAPISLEIEQNLPNDNTTEVTNEQIDKEIETLTSGNIIEKSLTKEQADYSEQLDYIDNDVKYSKYVIYINPENVDFIESLTIKERKNLINRLLREQDDIAISKRHLAFVQTMLKHILVIIITISISIPALYWIINASLEASINNYKKSESIFKTLYREKGKIKSLHN